MNRPYRVGRGAFALVGVLLVLFAAGCPLGRGSKKYGEACVDNNQCADANCAEIGKFCTKSCADDAECGTGRACINKFCESPSAAAPATAMPH